MLLLCIYSTRTPIFYILRIITTKKIKTELSFSEQLIYFFILLRFSYENKRKQMVIARNLQSQTGGIETHRTRWPRRDCRNIARDCKPFCSLNNSSKYFYVHTLIILCHRKQWYPVFHKSDKHKGRRHFGMSKWLNQILFDCNFLNKLIFFLNKITILIT